MKKRCIHIFIVLLIILTFMILPLKYICQLNSNRVLMNGTLKVEGTQLINRFGKPIQLRGVSSHGIQWDFENVICYENLKKLRDDWNINVFRIAMYTEENGYMTEQESIKRKATYIIDMCIDLDIYTIIDWHILKDNNPNQHKEEAKEFFDEISKKYKNSANVIYEICNEPNGSDVTWEKDIVPYANEVIPIIRKNSPKSIIIVGTPDYSKDIISAANKPLQFDNIMYAFHFYAGTHGQMYMENIDDALKKGLPIFVTEWGASTATDCKEFFKEESQEWLNFLNEKNISWVNWSFSNIYEATSIMNPGNSLLEENSLTEAGKFLESIFKK